MAQIDSDIEQNYEAIRESRGWSYETLAANLETGDKALAAHFRGKAESTTSDSAPRGRRGAKKAAETAEGDAETAEA